MNWSALWEAATAAGTMAMSVFTFVVILQNKRQHQDALRPLLALVPFDGVDPLDRSTLLSPRLISGPLGGERSFNIQCALENIGAGPALNVKVYFRFMNQKNYGVSRELAPLAAGETRGDVQHPLSIPLRPSQTFNEADFSFAAGTSWTIGLEYEDMFGNHFQTTHSKDPRLPWTFAAGIERQNFLSLKLRNVANR